MGENGQRGWRASTLPAVFAGSGGGPRATNSLKRVLALPLAPLWEGQGPPPGLDRLSKCVARDLAQSASDNLHLHIDRKPYIR